jgi:hypothetical protein
LHAIYRRDARGTARIAAFVEYLQRHLPRLIGGASAARAGAASRRPRA